MTARDMGHGVEVTVTVDECVADYFQPNGCRTFHYVTPEGDGFPAYFVTARGNDDVFAEELLRAEQYDDRVDELTELTDRVRYSNELGLDEGADGVVAVDGVAYVVRWADDVRCVNTPDEHDANPVAVVELTAREAAAVVAAIAGELQPAAEFALAQGVAARVQAQL